MTRISTLRPSLVGKWNERHILRVIQARGPLTRAEVARHSGLSAPTVSKAVGNLLDAGFLEERAAEFARGRPAAKLRLASARVQVLGVVIDAIRCSVVSAGFDGVLHPDAGTVPTPATYAELLDVLEAHCLERMAKPGVETLGVGVSVPGLIDAATGAGVLSPNLPITNGRTPAADLGGRLGVPGTAVQESHALCLAERHYGRAVGMDDYAVLDIGVGVGLGVMTGGRLLKGHSGLAGEIGHLTVVAEGGRPCGCGNTGCLETVCSEAAFAGRVARKLGRPVTADEALELVRSGRGPLAAELHETAVYVSVATAAVVNLFNPKTVFVHARLFDADDTLFERVVEMTTARALPPSAADTTLLRAKGTKTQGAVAGVVQQLTDGVAGHVPSM
jgi:N-acetylglucosamine repressor